MSGNPFVDKLFETAVAKAAALRALTPRNGNSDVLLFCSGDGHDPQWQLEGLVHGTRKQACRSFRTMRKLKECLDGYVVHIAATGQVCCFAGVHSLDGAT